MSMVPRDPFESIMPLRDAMSRLFEESFVGPRMELATGRAFPIDIYETDDKREYIVEASIPGVRAEDINVTAEGDTLTIRVMRKGEEKVARGNYVRHERYEGEMIRTLSLPTNIDPQKVQATYERGILTLHVPKSVSPKATQIQVSTKPS